MSEVHGAATIFISVVLILTGVDRMTLLVEITYTARPQIWG